jgi:acetyl esterase
VTAHGPMAHESMVYKRVAGRELTVDVFAPPAAGATAARPGASSAAPGAAPPARPAIAFFHGGGWVHGSPGEFHGACERYARRGYVALSFAYRLSITADGTTPHPDITPVESTKDARSAMRWIRANAASLGVDPDRVVAAGQSAGGQLALCTAIANGVDEETDDLSVSPEPAAIVLYASCVNTVIPWVDWHLGDRRDEIWSISPYHLARPGMPPVIHFHGEADCVVLPYQVRHFAARMGELGNACEVVWYEGRGHYLAPELETYATYFDEEVLERTDRFLAERGLGAGPDDDFA